MHQEYRTNIGEPEGPSLAGPRGPLRRSRRQFTEVRGCSSRGSKINSLGGAVVIVFPVAGGAAVDQVVVVIRFGVAGVGGRERVLN